MRSPNLIPKGEDPFRVLELERIVSEFTAEEMGKSAVVQSLVAKMAGVIRDQRLIAQSFGVSMGDGMDDLISARVEALIEPIMVRAAGVLANQLVRNHRKLLRKELRDLRKELVSLKSSVLMANLNPFLWLEGEIVRHSLAFLKSTMVRGASVDQIVGHLEKVGVSLPGSSAMDRYMAIVILLRRSEGVVERDGFWFELVKG